MNETEKDSQETPAECKPSWVKTRLFPILMLTFIVAIVVGVFLAYKYNPNLIEDLKGYGYLGTFVISVILNASVVLPVGNFAIIAVLGATLPSPTMVGLAGGLGAAIGEMTGYLAGFGGQALVANKTNRLYLKLEAALCKHGAPAIFVLSIFPFAFDIVGCIAGALRYPIWKFFIACWLGRTILYTAISWGSALGLQFILDFVN
ncbi:MAG: VTT domain-containing protein [Dehalococcoidales bacterium]